MTGVFPNSGVNPASTTNATTTASILAGCTALFYQTGTCNAYFEPAAMNALTSELLNAITTLGGEYDCNRLDNLATAILSPMCLSTDLASIVPTGPLPRLWYDDTDDILKIWDCDAAAYVDLHVNHHYAQSTIPTTPSLGAHWHDIDDNRLYVYTNDGTTSFWLEMTG